jgi:hypothetical protein
MRAKENPHQARVGTKTAGGSCTRRIEKRVSKNRVLHHRRKMDRENRPAVRTETKQPSGTAEARIPRGNIQR